MRTSPRSKVRLWRWRSNPLRRRSDAVEAWIVLVTWLVAVVAGGAAGVLSADVALRGAEHQREERYEAAARLIKYAPDAAQVSRGTAGGDRVSATVQWTTRDGATHTGRARVEPGLKAGAKTAIWVDPRGDVTSRPPGPVEGLLRAVWVGSMTAGGVGGAIVLGGWLVRRRLLCRRIEEWERDWARIGPQWGHRTS